MLRAAVADETRSCCSRRARCTSAGRPCAWAGRARPSAAPASGARAATWRSSAGGRRRSPAEEAADALAGRGIDATVVDLRWLAPLDDEAIAAAVARTNRVLVAHEANLTGGFGAEIAARIGERHFGDLDAPVRRVGAPDVRIPPAPVLQDGAAAVGGVDRASGGATGSRGLAKQRQKEEEEEMGYDEWVRRETSRRRFLRRAGVVTLTVGAGPTLLAACGDDDDDGGGGGERPRPRGRPGPRGERARGLPLLGGLRHPRPAQGLEAENGVTVKATYIGNHDEIQTKLKAGGAGAGYDIITYYQGYKPLYQELEILEPIDEQKLPNLKNLFPYFAERGGELLGRRRRHAHRRAVDVGLDRHHHRHAAGQVDAHVVVRPARAGVQGQAWPCPTIPSGSLALAAHVAGLRPVRDHQGRRREGVRPAVAGGRAVHRHLAVVRRRHDEDDRRRRRHLLAGLGGDEPVRGGGRGRLVRDRGAEGGQLLLLRRLRAARGRRQRRHRAARG